MAGKRVSELPSASTLNLGDVFPVLSSGVLRAATLGVLLRRFVGTLAQGTYRSAKIGVSSEGAITSIDNGLLRATATLDFPSIAGSAESELTISVPGAEVGDPVSVGLPAAFPSGIAMNAAWVSAADTVRIRLRNVTGSAIDPASASYTVVVHKA